MSMPTTSYPAIEKRRSDLGVSKKAVADKLNLSWDQANKKLAGEVEFNLSEVMVLADWWGLCLDELVGREVPKCPIYRIGWRGDGTGAA